MSHIGSKPNNFHTAIGDGVTTWLGVCTTGVVSWFVAYREQVFKKPPPPLWEHASQEPASREGIR